MPGMTDKPFSEYAERNGAPIQSVLQGEFANCTRVLEIGSGTGQHAVRFAKALPFLQWQTSDRDENHSGEVVFLVKVPENLALDYELIDVTENAAIVKLQVYKDSKHFSTDYMLLYKYKDGWKIVSKIFRMW